VGFARHARDQLAGEADADARGVRWQLGEQAVVVPAPLAEATAGRVEGDAGHDDRVDHLRIDGRARGFGDAAVPRGER
jgi:hypothetical protein